MEHHLRPLLVGARPRLQVVTNERVTGNGCLASAAGGLETAFPLTLSVLWREVLIEESPA